ncbi:Response regulator receiver domain-containing protein [Dyadobacter koreensis]|uniref:Response regulator receiver domain-containing protein n=1 Tax=Dyadobacter koreensis TaxID=408657 RepID=A0A1H6YNI0_9BACT|nr:response regulator [Dyadobacter koreensis]SEJ38295.1 Response regulator receiver domain-containing protein [Dyadobacter koreensis]
MKTSKELYIVDDSEDHRFIIQNIFSKFLPSYPVRLFRGAKELYELLILQADVNYQGGLPGLIILDMKMPVIKGSDLLRLLRQTPDNDKMSWKTFPIVMMSSQSSPQEIAECYQAGASSFFTKPTDYEELKILFRVLCKFWLDYNRLPSKIS